MSPRTTGTNHHVWNHRRQNQTAHCGFGGKVWPSTWTRLCAGPFLHELMAARSIGQFPLSRSNQLCLANDLTNGTKIPPNHFGLTKTTGYPCMKTGFHIPMLVNNKHASTKNRRSQCKTGGECSFLKMTAVIDVSGSSCGGSTAQSRPSPSVFGALVWLVGNHPWMDAVVLRPTQLPADDDGVRVLRDAMYPFSSLPWRQDQILTSRLWHTTKGVSIWQYYCCVAH